MATTAPLVSIIFLNSINFILKWENTVRCRLVKYENKVRRLKGFRAEKANLMTENYY